MIWSRRTILAIKPREQEKLRQSLTDLAYFAAFSPASLPNTMQGP